MKQILQNLKNGETTVVEVPSPTVKPGHLRIQTKLSLISSGTERMITQFGKSNYLNKAKQQPDKVVQVLNKIKTDGLESTLNTVSAHLDEPQPLGYPNIWIITHTGDGVDGVKVGNRVVSNWRHAEIVNVPKNLCAKIPDRVSDETAVFTVVSSIGLQGVRLTNPTIGETFVVYHDKIPIRDAYPHLSTLTSAVYDYCLCNCNNITSNHVCLPILYGQEKNITQKVVLELSKA